MEEPGISSTMAASSFSPTPARQRPLYRPQIYWTQPPNVVLRVLQVVFTLIAFSVMADILRYAFNGVRSFPYLLAINVLAFIYSLAHFCFDVWSLLRGGGASCMPGIGYQYVSFIADQLMAYLLVSCGSAVASIVDTNNVCPMSNYCSRVNGCLAFNFLAFMAFAASSLLTGFHLVRGILKA